MVSACSRQYAHRYPSRRSRERLVNGGVRTFDGKRTMSWRRTIEGIVTHTELERHTGGTSAVAIGSARPASNKMTARRSLTNCKGSNVALRRRTRPTVKNYRPTRWCTDHRAAATTARGSRCPSDPLTVAIRNSQYATDGRGNHGAWRHQCVRRSRQAARATTVTSRGWRARYRPSPRTHHRLMMRSATRHTRHPESVHRDQGPSVALRHLSRSRSSPLALRPWWQW